MRKDLDPKETLRMIESDLPKFKQLGEKEFDSDRVQVELEKLDKDELIQLQVNMFAQYHQMARIIVEVAEALQVALQQTDA